MKTVMQHKDHIPDILDCLAQLSNDEVPTPPKLARTMLDLLPADVWSNPDYKWLDPGCKSGVFLREIASRLLEGLTEWEPEVEKRREHIFRNMLYGTSVTEMTGHIARRSVYCSRDASGANSIVRFDSESGNIQFVAAKHRFGKDGTTKSCEVCGAPTELQRERRENYAYAFIHGTYPTKEMSTMKFDVIVGNPPYQINSDGNTRTKPIYQLFVQQAITMGPKHLLMITPSRWFAGGLGLDDFRQQMLASGKISQLVDYIDATDCFPGVDIQAGVSYFHWDSDHSGPTEVKAHHGGESTVAIRELNEFDIFVRDNRMIPVLRKVAARNDGAFSAHVSSTLPFGLRSNYRSKARSKDTITLYGRDRTSQKVDRSDIQMNSEWIDKWKVMLPAAYGERGKGPFLVIGKPFVAKPGSACTMTYIVAGIYETHAEAANAEAYLRTRFARFLICARKISQHMTADRFQFVPDLPMDRLWTDIDLFARYGLSDAEVKSMESIVREMPASPGTES